MRAAMAFVLLILIGVPLSPARAQLPQPDNGPFYRYIILLDGSSAMGRRKEAAAQTVAELIYGGFDGQIEPGDIFGIWTFQDTVDAVSVPAQRWTLNNRQIMAANAIKFITSFKYRKRSNLDAAVSEIVRATQVSKEVTVFLISDGNEVVYGTPYDLDISTTFVLHRQELSTAKQPFVTSIAARDGRMQAWAVDAGDGKVTVPRIPEKDPPAPPTKANPVTPPTSPTKPETAAQTPKPMEPAKPAHPPIVKSAETGKPPSAPPQAIVPAPSKPKLVVVQTIAPPRTTSTPIPSPSVETLPESREPVKITQPRSNNNTTAAEPRSARLTRSQSSSRQFPGAEPSLPKPLATTPSISKENPPPPPLSTIPTTDEPAAASAPATTVTTQTPNKPDAAPVTPPPAPTPPTVATKTATTPATDASPAAANPPATSLDKTPEAPPAPTAAQTGIILPTEEPAGPTRILFFTLTLLLITGILAFLALRRNRPPAQASLISQSLDRERN